VSQDVILAVAWRRFAGDPTPEAALDYCVKRQRVEGQGELGDLTYPEVVDRLDLSKQNRLAVKWAFARAAAVRIQAEELRAARELVPMRLLADQLVRTDFSTIYGVGKKTLAVVEEAFAYCGLVLAEGCHQGTAARRAAPADYEQAYYQMRGSWGEACRELERLRGVVEAQRLKIGSLEGQLIGVPA
jgi:hypothetical protein